MIVCFYVFMRLSLFLLHLNLIIIKADLILIIFLLIYLVAGVAINLTVGNNSVNDLKENPILIIQTPFNYILHLINNKN